MEKKEQVPATVEATQTQPTQEPSDARHVALMSQYYPDKKFDTDAQAIDALCEECEATKAQLKTLEDANRRIYELIQQNPAMADVITEMDKGAPFEVALAKCVDLEALVPTDGEPQYEAYQKAVAERKQRTDEITSRRAALETNQAKSKADADEFFDEMKIDEKEQNDFVDFVESFIGDLFAGKVAKATLKKMYQAFKYEEDIAAAADQGVVAGRNQAIEAKRETKSATDGLPSAGAGVGAEPTKANPRKVFNL